MSSVGLLMLACLWVAPFLAWVLRSFGASDREAIGVATMITAIITAATVVTALLIEKG